MALKKSEIYSAITKCANKLRSNSGIGAESFKNYVLIILFLKYVSDRKKTGESSVLIVPDGCTFDDIKALPNKELCEGINKIIERIAEENELEDYITLTDHDFCDKKLGNAEDSAKLVRELVNAFDDAGLDFSQNRAADDDLIGDAYEFLMRNFASQSGKDKGQFYTPTEVSRLMALLVGIDLDDRPQVSGYDPTCGSCSLLLRLKAAAKHNISMDGQDIDPANIELSYLNMVIHGCETADIRKGDTLNNPQHVDNGRLRQYDYVVSNPKFSLHNWMSTAKAEDIYGRWNPEIGVPPQYYADFAFLMHCVKSLKEGGKCAIILPNGVLTRSGDEERLRRWLVEQRLLSGIVAFPANTFFGTSIAGNVLMIDKNRTKDGVFFIDASNLGEKDEDSKIRLREQDIKRIIDVWRKREDVPHFAHLATFDVVKTDGDDVGMYEIERNNFSLNISLYVTPIDKEIHQNIEAHLHGGIPEEEIAKMQEYWNACPSLQGMLFAPFKPGFSRLAIDKDAISQTIESEPSFVSQNEVFRSALANWCEDMKPTMLAVGKDNDPKGIIATWSQSILDAFRSCRSLVGEYDVYDQLMRYYNASLQDDLYMISRDGWQAQLIRTKTKNLKWTDLVCDLLPVTFVVNRYFAETKQALDDKANELSDIQSQMETLVEENEDDFDSSLFYGKFTTANVKKKLANSSTPKLSDENVAFLQSLLPYFEKNNKDAKATRAALCATRPDLFADPSKVSKKVVGDLLKNADQWEYSTPEQRDCWAAYLQLADKEKALKDTIKVLAAELLKKIEERYATITEDEVRDIVVCDKWLSDIRECIAKEMRTVTHNITADINALVFRYEHTLSELTDMTMECEDLVINGLKEMGFTL